MNLVLAVFAVFLLLVISELWWRHHKTHGEFSRKFIHITVGSFVAFWPYFLSWNQIRFLSVAFLVVVLISKRLHLFRAIHSVQRATWGELFFAMAVGVVTFLTNDKAIYTAALLQMSLADGLAAVLGVRYGKAKSYLVFGHRKSLVGTATFFLASFLILLGFVNFSAEQLAIGYLVLIAGVATTIENLGVKGLDNLLVPVVVALMLISPG